MDTFKLVSENPLLGILRNVPLKIAEDYVEAAIKGGVSFFEVALNSPDALKEIELLKARFGDTCKIGAGTAITVPLCRSALDAGAEFLLTPGTPPSVFEFCAKNGVSLIPGVLTPNDVAVSLEYGYSTMKLFPAGSMPKKYIRDLKGPFDNTNYMAIGGVSPDNITDFFEMGYIGVGLASSLMPKEAVKARDWETCTAYVKNMVEKIS